MINTVMDRLISEGVMAPDVAEQIQEAFEAKVLAEVEKRLADRSEALEEEFKEKQSQLMSYADEWSENLMNLAEEWSIEQSNELENKIDEYLSLTVEQWISDNENKIDSLIESKKIEALSEGFKALLVTGAVTLDELQESSENENRANIEESKRLNKELDRIASKAMEYKRERDELLQAKLVNEACEGLTYTQSEKLKELAEGITFDSDRIDGFENQLSYLKDTIFSRGTGDAGNFASKRKANDSKPSSSLLARANHLF